MPIYLPGTPLFQSASPTPIIFGGWQTPPTGGVESWVGFMGTRMSVAFATPRLKPEPDGRLWTAALLDAWMEGAIVAARFPQPGFDVMAPGLPVVDGAGQAGMTLNVRGLTPSYPVRRRQFFSAIHGGRRYLHYATAQVIAGSDGRASIPIGPMLRAAFSDGDVCELGAPMIEGKLTGDARGWTHVIAKVEGLSFTIAEIA